MNRVLRRLQQALLSGDGRTDAQLLERFVARRDETAFTALVRRHGPMVLGVCRRTAGHADDADDAFQATFLVLARKAASIRAPAQLGAWLYGVAYRTARKARAAADRLRARERQVTTMPQPGVEVEDRWHEIAPLLDQELSRLPDKYRRPIILCDLEGNPRREAARRLGVPEGTLSSRLATGRRMLAHRLTRLGLAVSGGALAAALTVRACAAVPAALSAAAIRGVLLSATAATAVSAKVAALTEGAIKAMLWTKLKIAAVVLAGGLVLAGSGAAALGPGNVRAAGPAKAATTPPATDDNADAKDAVWTLDFRFKALRTYEYRAAGQAEKPIWYLSYTIGNPTDQEHTFIPDFELTIPDKEVHHDQTPSAALRDFIEQAEDPSGSLGRLQLKTSVTIAAEPIPPSKSAAGVAVWDDVDPDLERCSIYVYGLSNGWTMDDGQLRRKTLELNFKRVGAEMRLDGEPRWLYIPSHGGPSKTPDYKTLYERYINELDKQRQKDQSSATIADPNKTLAEKDKEIAALRDKLESAQIQIDALTERCKTLEKKIAELDAEKDERLLEEIDRRIKDKEKEKPDQSSAAPPIEGEVKYAEDGLVVISLGSDAGIAKGATLDVYRLDPATYLGQLQIIEVRDRESVGKPVGKPPKPLQAGDHVTSKISGK